MGQVMLDAATAFYTDLLQGHAFGCDRDTCAIHIGGARRIGDAHFSAKLYDAFLIPSPLIGEGGAAIHTTNRDDHSL